MVDTLADFWWYLRNAFGSALPWVMLLIGITAIALFFRGRVAGKWIFPLLVAAGAFWVIRRVLWYYF